MNDSDSCFVFFMAVTILALWVIFSFVVAHEAMRSGRSRLAYFCLALFGSPILAGIVLGIQGPAPGSPKAIAVAQPRR